MKSSSQPSTPRWLAPLAVAVAVLIWPVAFVAIFSFAVGDDILAKKSN